MNNDLLWYFAIMALGHWALYLVSTAIKSLVTGLHYMQARTNETELGKRLEVDDRFFKYLTDAVEGMLPIAEDIKKAASDGKLDEREKEDLRNKAWQMFKDRLGMKDITDFGKALIPKFKPDMDKTLVEDAAKKKFLSLLPKAVEDAKLAKASAVVEVVRGALPPDPVPPVVVQPVVLPGSGPGNS